VLEPQRVVEEIQKNIKEILFGFFSWWRTAISGMFFLLGGWGERSCPISATESHEMGVDRPSKLSIERRTLLPASYRVPRCLASSTTVCFFSVSAVMCWLSFTRILKHRCVHMIFKSPRLEAFRIVATQALGLLRDISSKGTEGGQFNDGMNDVENEIVQYKQLCQRRTPPIPIMTKL